MNVHERTQLAPIRTETQFPTLESRERPLDPGPRPPSPREEDSGPRCPETGSPGQDNLMKRCAGLILSKPSDTVNAQENNEYGATR